MALLAGPVLAQNKAAQPSVLVTTEVPREGSLPRTLSAYGTVQAGPDGGSETLSLLRGGQVTRVAAVVGQAVRKGQPLLAVSADPAALAAFRQATAALTLARGERARTAQMLAQHLATRDQLAQADAAVADAQSTLDTLNRGGGGSAEQVLSAPFDGVVSALPVAAGSRVAAQTPLLTLTRIGRLVASVGIEPDQRSQVAAGQAARIEALYGGGGEEGSVLSVGAMLDPQSRLVPVLVDPPATAHAGASATLAGSAGLMPGDPVRVVIQVGAMSGWLVPRGAVLTDGKGAYVFQVNGDKARRVDVRIVGTEGNTTVVDGQLDPAQQVVTSGNYQLEDGGAVRQAPDKGAKP